MIPNSPPLDAFEFERRRQAERVEEFALALELERGKLQLDRGKLQLDRGKLQLDRGKLQLDRGKLQLDRGKLQLDRGGPAQVAADVLQRATSLGGHLIVAFIAPVGASGQESADTPMGPRTQPDGDFGAAIVGSLIVQALHKFSATPGGPKTQPMASRRAETPKTSPYKEPGKSSGGLPTAG